MKPFRLPEDRSLWIAVAQVAKELGVSICRVDSWAKFGVKSPGGRAPAKLRTETRARIGRAGWCRYTTREELARFLAATNQPATPVT